MLLSDIKSLLTGITTSIFLNEIPDTPDNILGVFFSGGQSPEMAFGSRTFEQPSFQVRVRHTTGATAILWAEQVKDTLNGINGLTIGSTRYLSIMQTGDILPLGKDAKARSEYSVNFQTKLQR
jgi:hypothetical protein